jgi:hypothetical protein
VTASAQDCSRIDDFLPTHDFSAAYAIRIDVPSTVVYQCLLRSDFNKPWVVRLLMSIRSGKPLPRNRVPGDLPQRLKGTGFVTLADVPGDELVIGVAGKFWRPDGGRCLDLTAGDFGGFSRAGYAKERGISGSERNRPSVRYYQPRRGSSASVGRRCGCFRIYWSLVGPFSGLIPKAILRQVKTEAESTLTADS